MEYYGQLHGMKKCAQLEDRINSQAGRNCIGYVFIARYTSLYLDSVRNKYSTCFYHN